MAKARGIGINRLIDELATSALTQHYTETRFRALAGRGKRKGYHVVKRCFSILKLTVFALQN
jgi:hypothetical protein